MTHGRDRTWPPKQNKAHLGLRIGPKAPGAGPKAAWPPPPLPWPATPWAAAPAAPGASWPSMREMQGILRLEWPEGLGVPSISVLSKNPSFEETIKNPGKQPVVEKNDG